MWEVTAGLGVGGHSDTASLGVGGHSDTAGLAENPFYGTSKIILVNSTFGAM